MAYGSGLMDVIQSSTAGVPPQFNDGNGTQTGTLCRAWVNFNGTGTVAIRASFNVSSITDNGTGDYTVNFTNAMSDANYSYSANVTRSTLAAGNDAIALLLSQSTSNIRIQSTTSAGAALDSLYCNVEIFR